METQNNSFLDFIGKFDVLIASATALFIAGWGRWLRSLVYKPHVGVIKLVRLNQTHELSVWRLVVKNKGNATAKNVQADVVEIIDAGVKRKDFLPVPLRWTHLNIENRDVYSGQTVYIDLFDEIAKGKQISNLNCEIRLCSRFGLEVSKFTRLKEGESKVRLRFFISNGNSFDLRLKCNWDGDLFFESEIIK